MYQPLFETERLRCRRWVGDDIEALLAVYADAEAMRWVGDGEPLSRTGCEEWLQVTGMFALEERASNAVVGFCGLVHPGGQVEAEVKYAFLRSHWGRGLATEAVRALLAYGAAAYAIKRVIATVAPANLASQRVLLKAGMFQGRLRRNEDGSDTQLFEWLAAKPNVA